MLYALLSSIFSLDLRNNTRAPWDPFPEAPLSGAVPPAGAVPFLAHGSSYGDASDNAGLCCRTVSSIKLKQYAIKIHKTREPASSVKM